MTFRDDGAAALEWVAEYLERLREFPVLAQVEPGEIAARLPAEPPDAPELVVGGEAAAVQPELGQHVAPAAQDAADRLHRQRAAGAPHPQRGGMARGRPHDCAALVRGPRQPDALSRG